MCIAINPKSSHSKLGGTGEYTEDTPPMLGIWNTLLEGSADATWIFLQWEGVEAKLKGVELNAFRVCDYGMPYAYAPCLCAHPDWLAENSETAKLFLAATAEGYKRAAADPAAAADALVRLAKTENNGFEIDPALALGSAEHLKGSFLDEAGAWGRMEDTVWDSYVEWLWDAGLLTTGVQSRHPSMAGNTTSKIACGAMHLQNCLRCNALYPEKSFPCN
jgi:ABC-type nitrate/sulfonate/bicarbonate transport system substrate-binding protein